MSELQCVARLKIHDGKLDEFKRLAAKCAELVRTKDTGTLQYELYFNSDNTECLVFERYRDSQALLDHHKNLGTQWQFCNALANDRMVRHPRPLSGALIVTCRSTSSQPSDDLNELLPSLKPCSNSCFSGACHPHLGKQRHRAKLVGKFNLAALCVVGLRQSVIGGYFCDGSIQNLHQVLN